MRFLRTVALFAVAASAVAAPMACGPSFQAIYEGNARFEHCYALEERAQTPLVDKSDCWRDWSERYTYGQTRDRIHYATARYVALSQSMPTDEAMMMAAPGMAQRTSTITAPIPTNAFAPPPKVLDQPDASAGKPLRPSELHVLVGPGGAPMDAGTERTTPLSGAAPPAPAQDAGKVMHEVPLPLAGCVDACGQRFHACKGAACEKDYRACMRDCVK